MADEKKVRDVTDVSAAHDATIKVNGPRVMRERVRKICEKLEFTAGTYERKIDNLLMYENYLKEGFDFVISILHHADFSEWEALHIAPVLLDGYSPSPCKKNANAADTSNPYPAGDDAVQKFKEQEQTATANLSFRDEDGVSKVVAYMVTALLSLLIFWGLPKIIGWG